MICKNVPLARVGVQDYLGTEIGMNNSDVYKVTRPDGEVFSKAAMASFEGKPVCEDHPPVDVDSDNYKAYMKGIVRDIRKGTDRFSDCMVGDLIIYDHDLCKAIEDGKREISCGYDCLWVQTADRAFEQRDIRGNHIAVVEKGRAGKKVAIRDQAPEIKKRSDKHMSKSILERMFSSFVKDAEPGEILEASKLVNKGEGDDPTNTEVKPAMDAAIDERFKKIEDALGQLCGQRQQAPVQDKEPDPDMDGEQGPGEPDGDEGTEALDALEGELADEPQGEEAVTEDPEDINAEAEDAEPEDVPAEPIPAPSKATRDQAMDAIRAMRPLLAQIPNPLQRKRAADSLAVMIRGQVRDEQYKALMRAQKASVKKTMDSADERTLGKKWRDQFNPHYRKSE